VGHRYGAFGTKTLGIDGAQAQRTRCLFDRRLVLADA
jgi:hypothetical protein